jgi:hypothetical protein
VTPPPGGHRQDQRSAGRGKNSPIHTIWYSCERWRRAYPLSCAARRAEMAPSPSLLKRFKKHLQARRRPLRSARSTPTS